MPGSASLDPNVLVDSLLTTVDSVRDLYRTLGATQWRVFTVRRVWSGTHRGEGTSVDTAVELLPTPLVTDMRGRALDPAGMHEDGQVMLKELSLTYTEAQLLGGTVAANEEWFYKLVENRGQHIVTRFYNVGKAPPQPDRMQTIGWIITLNRAEGAD
jgi:hypothetical protein